MDALSMAVALIVIIFLAILIQYLLNPSWHKLGLPRHLEKEESDMKTREITEEEKDFYREIWTAKKRKS